MSLVTNFLADLSQDYDDMCHKIVHMQARHNHLLPLRLAVFQWASEKVTKQVLSVMKRVHRKFLEDMLTSGPGYSDFAVLRGKLLDEIAHVRFAQGGHAFTFCSLRDGRLCDAIISARALTEKMMYGVNDVASVEVEEYGRPGRKNFPSIDVVIRLPAGHPLAEGLGTEYMFL
jgi:hypothetical protein